MALQKLTAINEAKRALRKATDDFLRDDTAKSFRRVASMHLFEELVGRDWELGQRAEIRMAPLPGAQDSIIDQKSELTFFNRDTIHFVVLLDTKFAGTGSIVSNTLRVEYLIEKVKHDKTAGSAEYDVVVVFDRAEFKRVRIFHTVLVPAVDNDELIAAVSTAMLKLGVVYKAEEVKTLASLMAISSHVFEREHGYLQNAYPCLAFLCVWILKQINNIL